MLGWLLLFSTVVLIAGVLLLLLLLLLIILRMFRTAQTSHLLHHPSRVPGRCSQHSEVITTKSVLNAKTIEEPLPNRSDIFVPFLSCFPMEQYPPQTRTSLYPAKVKIFCIGNMLATLARYNFGDVLRRC